MSYYTCLGKKDIFGNQAIPSSQTTHIYKDFRFRDPTCIDTGRTKNIAINPLFAEDEYTQVISTIQENGIAEYTDENGFVWHLHDGIKPDDHQFTRHPNNKNIDSRPDRWQFGTQCREKSQIPDHSGYIMSSTIAVQKQRGVIG